MQATCLLHPLDTKPPLSLTFSTSAKLSLSTLRSTGTTRPLGVATAIEMSV
jgi:hypothetical protein